MPRFDGEVFLLGTAISAPVPFQKIIVFRQTYAQMATLASKLASTVKTPKTADERRLLAIFGCFASPWNADSTALKTGRVYAELTDHTNDRRRRGAG
jgi:hypothetical protein